MHCQHIAWQHPLGDLILGISSVPTTATMGKASVISCVDGIDHVFVRLIMSVDYHLLHLWVRAPTKYV